MPVKPYMDNYIAAVEGYIVLCTYTLLPAFGGYGLLHVLMLISQNYNNTLSVQRVKEEANGYCALHLIPLPGDIMWPNSKAV